MEGGSNMARRPLFQSCTTPRRRKARYFACVQRRVEILEERNTCGRGRLISRSERHTSADAFEWKMVGSPNFRSSNGMRAELPGGLDSVPAAVTFVRESLDKRGMCTAADEDGPYMKMRLAGSLFPSVPP